MVPRRAPSSTRLSSWPGASRPPRLGAERYNTLKRPCTGLSAPVRIFSKWSSAPPFRATARASRFRRGPIRAASRRPSTWAVPSAPRVGRRAGAPRRRRTAHKAYHRPDPAGPRGACRRAFPRGCTRWCTPATAIATEHYLQLRTPCAWGRVRGGLRRAPRRSPLRLLAVAPRVEGAFGVSVRREGDRVTAVSLYADQRSLPGRRRDPRRGSTGWPTTIAAPTSCPGRGARRGRAAPRGVARGCSRGPWKRTSAGTAPRRCGPPPRAVGAMDRTEVRCCSWKALSRSTA